MLILIGLGLIGATFWLDASPIDHTGQGPVAPATPVQTETRAPAFRFRKDYTIRPLADFAVTARVLSRRRYFADPDAKIAPVDLALGWGPMSDDAVLSHLKLSQDSRWFRYRYRKLPIPQDEIDRHAANMHLIPADRVVARGIKSARAGDIVRFHGHLVRVHGKDGRFWQSSLTRTDTGKGACEVVFVRGFSIVTRHEGAATP